MSTRRTRGGRNVGGKHGSMTHLVLSGSSESDERLACSDVDTVTAMGKSETSVRRRSSDEDDDEADASCEWSWILCRRARPSLDVRGPIARRPCIHLYALVQYCGGSARNSAHMCALWAHNLLRACADIIHVA